MSFISGARILVPGGDWHQPEVADIVIAGDPIVGIAPRYAQLSGQICRCTGYGNIVTAIKSAAAELRLET